MNQIEVCGKREDLDKFKHEVAEDKKTDFSFQKIIPMPEDTSGWAEDDYPGDFVWMKIHWGAWEALNAYMSDEGDHLGYSFQTRRWLPIPIFDALLDKYGNTFDFKIFNAPEGDSELWEFEFTQGEVKKHILKRFDHIPLSNGKCKRITECHNLLNNSKKVIKEIIDNPERKVHFTEAENIDNEVSREEVDEHDDDLLAELDAM
jgi:hypothetical protein